MVILLLISSAFYCLLMLVARLGLETLRHGQPPSAHTPPPAISVIIPFRNESTNISLLINDLKNQKCRPHEVILVDDHSRDGSGEVVAEQIKTLPYFNLVSLTSEEQGKKAALAAGIKESTGEFLATADADVRLEPEWLSKIASAIETQQADMLILPVRVQNPSGGFIGLFQQAENLAVQAITMGCAAVGWPVSCNGANLVFRKSAFQLVAGYQSHEKTASGDDVFLMHQFLKHKLKVIPVLNEQVVATTNAEESFHNALKQRLRWAGKSGKMVYSASAVVGVILLVHSVVLLVTFSFVGNQFMWWMLFVLKIVWDVLLIKYMAYRYHQPMNVLKLAFIASMYTAYLPVISLASAVWKPEWKGRKT